MASVSSTQPRGLELQVPELVRGPVVEVRTAENLIDVTKTQLVVEHLGLCRTTGSSPE